ncbi:MAG: D-alanyl-D-alanine carboxypeptidase [Actinomycetota bacterium]|nr:D-alanyl-D-alanine carboxypeptidase [Actinomycetota bacterium]
MNEIDRSGKQHETPPRRVLTDEERRALVEKRIRELRRSKRREQRRKNKSRRTAITALVALLLLLFIASGIYNLATSGEDEVYQASELSPSNLTDLEELVMARDEVSMPAVSAAAAILVDAATGDVLYEVNADTSLPMASTTKVMTALVTMENSSMDENVTVSEYASSIGESSAWLDAGEVLTVEQLLYALMLQSGNDASVALAEHVAGSENAFVEMMNARARELGLGNTCFANPHGLDEQGHYTSARDLAEIASMAMAMDVFREIVAAQTYEIPWPGHPYPRVMENHNKLLKLYPAATGIKTGYTANAGKCLVASSRKDGRELITVILDGGESYWDQTISLMEYGFNNFALVEFAYAGQPVARVEVGDFPRREVNAVGSEDLVFTVRRDRLASYGNATINCLMWVPYPVNAGQELGYMVVAEGTLHESREPLVSDAGRSRPNFLTRSISFVGSVFGLWWKGVKWAIPGI